MAKLSEAKVFNNKNSFVDGWYWALKTSDLKAGKVKGVQVLGRHLAIFRGISGNVYALDAFCPHMGAHFKEGKVDGESIRCAFHDWKFSSDGKCTDIPCKKIVNQAATIPPVNSYRVEEKYGLIWVHTRPIHEGPLAEGEVVPHLSELGLDDDLEIMISKPVLRPCRPEVVLINAIDCHHFNTVHPLAKRLAGELELKAVVLSPFAIRLENRNPVPKSTFIGKVLEPFYKKGVLTYFLDYWYGSTGSVTLGPDFQHFNLFFPHRPTASGGTEGYTIAAIKKRKGILGKIYTKLICKITLIVGSYFEKGDHEIYKSIQFSMKAPIKADHSIIEFIRHMEKQKARSFPWTETEDIEMSSTPAGLKISLASLEEAETTASSKI